MVLQVTILLAMFLGNSYPVSSYPSPGPGMDYDDPLECEDSEINCPACLLQVPSLQLNYC